MKLLGNKVFKAPKSNEFRPITVLSAAYKWLELRFMNKLKAYLVNELDRN